MTDARTKELAIDILLDDKCKGWAAATRLDNLATIFPDLTAVERYEMSRLMSRDAWAYRDELETKPSDELMRMAGAVTERSRREERLRREAEERERKRAMFNRWARKASWEPDEAARLACGHDPKGPAPDDEEFADLLDTIKRAIKAGQLKRDISPPAFLAWLRERGIPFPPGLDAAMAELAPVQAEPAPTPAPTPAPALEHVPELLPLASPFHIKGYDCPEDLNVMMQAIELFWIDADRTKPPKQAEIIDFLTRQGISENRAKSIDAIIRPEWARSGGNKKWPKV